MNQLTLDLQPPEPEYRLIPLTQGQFAKIDAEDFERISQWKWCAQWDPKSCAYRAVRCVWEGTPKKIRHIKMANLILSVERSEPDHINHNPLDNRRANLRPASHMQNSWNRRRRSDNASGFKGVHFNKEQRKWRARIMANGRRTLLGDFDTPQQAHAAYVDAAKKLHGEFACF